MHFFSADFLWTFVYLFLHLTDSGYKLKIDAWNFFQSCNVTMHYGSAWVDRWSQVLLLGFWHVIHQNCRPFAVVLYLKELYKFVFSIWSKKQLKEMPLRALKGGKMPLNIFLQASKQLFWLKVQCHRLKKPKTCSLAKFQRIPGNESPSQRLIGLAIVLVQWTL